MKQQNQQNSFAMYQFNNQKIHSLSSRTRSNFASQKTLRFSQDKQKKSQQDRNRESVGSSKTTLKSAYKEMVNQKDQQDYNQKLTINKKINGKEVGQNLLDKALKTLQEIKKWRKDNIAPVDVVGCERLNDSTQPIEVQKYQILIALILSVQTNDKITGKIMGKLKNYGLTPQKMCQISQSNLLELIKQTNFNKRKVKNIIEASKIILQSGLPRNKQQLMQFPGVGMKIATIYMRAAEGVNDGIGVDTHVHRISQRLGWVKNTKNPNQTEEKLQQLFPKQYWDDINIALVGFGQTLCEAKKPKCGQCPVKKLCPSSTFKQRLTQF